MNWPGTDEQPHQIGEGNQLGGKIGGVPVQDQNLKSLQN